jgi:hypothetical protein
MKTQKLCSFDGCDKAAICKGLCPAHYQQQRHGKELKPLQVQYHGYSETTRFLKRVDMRGKNECWEWLASRNTGYGQWHANGTMELTHRASYRLFVGPVPEGMFVCHKCDNPICVNPDHLFLGTQTDNMRDMWAKKRERPGRPKGEQHGMAKLTADIVKQIRESQDTGLAAAARFGVSHTTVSDIRLRKIWKHV